MKRRLYMRLLCGALAAMLAFAGARAKAMSVLQSDHNLSATGPGTIKANAEKDACIFCHSAHNSVPKSPLWNRNSSGATYTPYTSSTLKAVVGQPNGSSKMCLSCHDGTVALGLVASRSCAIQMNNNVVGLPPGTNNLGTDLSGDHPISFTYNAALASSDGQLQDPTTLTGPVKLDENQQMQCTSCHDPHDNRYGNFLVEDNTSSALCSACHSISSWSSSAHNISTARWNGQGRDPWPNSKRKTVSANGCENCHASHKAGTKSRLLKEAGEDQDCYVCHSGTVARQNIRPEFSKLSVHPVMLTSAMHDEKEDPVNGPRHASCVDCHNPHTTQPGTALAPNASGAIKGVMGVNSAGTVITKINRQYELCYRCHADSPGRAQASVPRRRPETNKRLQFSRANASYHPIEGPGKNPNVPSLIAPYTTTSIIYCTDCHNNDSGPGAGGSGPNGPHGSAYAPLLERQEILTDLSPESGASYALCYKCHSRASILSNQSFPGHSSHIINYKTACTTCHDSHGSANNPGLINFNTAYVTPAGNGVLSYLRTGTYQANCTLNCHGSEHVNKNYNSAVFSRRKVVSPPMANFH
jgi:predicted CXXCH cytochrome family protein